MSDLLSLLLFRVTRTCISRIPMIKKKTIKGKGREKEFRLFFLCIVELLRKLFTRTRGFDSSF